MSNAYLISPGEGCSAAEDGWQLATALDEYGKRSGNSEPAEFSETTISRSDWSDNWGVFYGGKNPVPNAPQRNNYVWCPLNSNALNIVAAKGYDAIDSIAHSWGTCVTYDAIEQSGLYIKNWVTMGSPLRGDTAKPGNVGRWIDFYSNTDPVTWLNIFPPFVPVSSETIPSILSNLTGHSAERIHADNPWNVTGMAIPSDASRAYVIFFGPFLEHPAYWTNWRVLQELATDLK